MCVYGTYVVPGGACVEDACGIVVGVRDAVVAGTGEAVGRAVGTGSS